MTDQTEREQLEATIDDRRPEPPRCTDCDDDCPGWDALACWLYDPAKGFCPFLRRDAQ